MDLLPIDIPNKKMFTVVLADAITKQYSKQVMLQFSCTLKDLLEDELVIGNNNNSNNNNPESSSHIPLSSITVIDMDTLYDWCCGNKSDWTQSVDFFETLWQNEQFNLVSLLVAAEHLAMEKFLDQFFQWLCKTKCYSMQKHQLATLFGIPQDEWTDEEQAQSERDEVILVKKTFLKQ